MGVFQPYRSRGSHAAPAAVRRVLPWLLALSLGLLLGGCSRFGLIYNRLDTLVGMQIRPFVDPTPAQQADFDLRFGQLWLWHRQTQMPLYAEDLRKLAALSFQPLDVDEVGALAEQTREHLRRLLDKACEALAPTIASLNDAQVGDILAETTKKVAKQGEEARKFDDDAWREQRAEEAIDRLDEWAGSVTAEQRQRIKEWAAGLVRPPVTGEDANLEEGLQPIRDLLAQRGEPDFADRLRGFMLESSGAGDSDEERQAARQMLADLSSLANDRQRRHFQKRLESLASNLDEIAAQKPR